MAGQYRVVDLRLGAASARDIIVDRGTSPEDAALHAIGETLIRSGHRDDLRVRVYFQQSEQPVTMVRLHRRAEDRP